MEYEASDTLKALLAKKVDDAKKPQALPAGTYRGKISRFKFDTHPYFKDEGEQPLLGAMLYIQLSSAEDDVLEELKEQGVEIGKKFTSYFMEFRRDGSRDWRNAEIIRSCGISTEGRGYGETIPELVGKDVVLEISRTPNKKQPGEFNNNVDRISGVG